MNLSETERGVRVAIGILLLIVAVFASGALATGWRWLLAVVGVALLVTATTGSCPVYRLLGRGSR